MRWLVDLLANEQVVKSLLGYLMATEVGDQGRNVEKEVEWEQRMDQVGKELLSSR